MFAQVLVANNNNYCFNYLHYIHGIMTDGSNSMTGEHDSMTDKCHLLSVVSLSLITMHYHASHTSVL